MRELIELFLEEGAAEHIRPELAFAQSILETGSFGHATRQQLRRDRRVRQLQRQRDRLPDTTRRSARPDAAAPQLRRSRIAAADLANPPSPPIFGRDPASAAASFDSYVAKGRIPTWNLMGNGNWATDPVYAPKVLAHLLRHDQLRRQTHLTTLARSACGVLPYRATSGSPNARSRRVACAPASLRPPLLAGAPTRRRQTVVRSSLRGDAGFTHRGSSMPEVRRGSRGPRRPTSAT